MKQIKFTDFNYVVLIMLLSISIIGFLTIKYKFIENVITENEPPKGVWNNTNNAEGSISEINKSLIY